MTKVKQELDEILANKPIKALKIFDSTFTADRDHVISFCKMIKSYNLLWECEIKADTVDYQLLKIMRDAGCYYIDMGLETTNEKLLKSLGKNITILQAKQVLDWCKELNIKTKVFFIFGLLDETYHDCKVDLKFLKEHKSQIDLFATTIGLRIYPGTSTAKELKKRGIMPESFSWANYKPSIKNLILFEFSNTYILEQKQLSFYKLFLVIILMVKQNTVLSPGHVKKLIFQNSKAFIHFLFIKFTH